MPLLATPSRQERFADPIALAGLATFAFGCVRFTALAHLGLVLLLVAFVLRVSDRRAVLLNDGLVRLSAFWILWFIGLAAWASSTYPGTAQFSSFKQNCAFVFIPLVAMATRGRPRRTIGACLLALAGVLSGLLMDVNLDGSPFFHYELFALGGPRNVTVAFIDTGILGCIALLFSAAAAQNFSTRLRWGGITLCVAALALLLTAWLSVTSRTSLVILPVAVLLQCALAWRGNNSASRISKPVLAGVIFVTALLLPVSIDTVGGRLAGDQITLIALGGGNLDAVTADSAGLRVQMWRLAFLHWSTNPWTGVGPSVTHLLAQTQEFPDINNSPHFHSSYIDALLRTGVIGILIYSLVALMIAKALHNALREGAIPRLLGHFLICSLLVFLALNVTDSVVYINQGWRFMVLLAGLAYGYRWADSQALRGIQPESAVPQAPRTVVFLRYVGFGDLIWHLPYIRALAKTSSDSKVTVIAAPSTLAPEILSIEPCVGDVILFDRNARRHEDRRPSYRGLSGLWRFAASLRHYKFDRMVLFSGRTHHALLAWLADIPQRAGFGQSLAQQLFLNSPPYIDHYQGPAVPQYEDAANFAIIQRILPARIAPKMHLPEIYIQFGLERCSTLPICKVALIIGTSERHKHWGDDKFAELTKHLASSGCGVILTGGPRERIVAERIITSAKLSLDEASRVVCLTDASVLQTAGVLRTVQIAVGNDTGALNLAAANDRPCICTLGKRPLLLHDPLITCIADKEIGEITVREVLGRIEAVIESLDFGHKNSKS